MFLRCGCELDFNDVLSSTTLIAVNRIELDALAFLQRLEAVALDR